MTDASIATFPPLVVGTDPEAVKKTFRVPLAMSWGLAVFAAVAAVLIAAMMASVSGMVLGLLSALPFLLVSLSQGYSAAKMAGNVSARAAAGTVLTLDAAGLTSNTPQGLIVLPWGAIASVETRRRGRHTIAAFRVFDGVTPQSPGVQTTVKPAAFRYLTKKGFRIGSAGIDVPVQTILDATAAFTAGRLVAR